MRYYDTHISTFNGYSLTYSIDKVIILGFFEFGKIDYVLKCIDKLYYKHFNKTSELLLSVPFKLGELYYWHTTYYENRKNLSFFHNFNFEIKDGLKDEINSFWLGVGFNRFGNIDYTRWKLEFNPNKVMCDFTYELMQILQVNSYDVELKEYDIAIDFPLKRDLFSLSTNNGRKYSLIKNSCTDKTEYSGIRHTNGFTKIYNKTLESKLDKELTRIEFTFTDINYSEIITGLPDMHITDFKQLEIDEVGGTLNDTEQFILNTLIDYPDRINELGRYMKKKMSNILKNYVYSYTLTEKDFLKCMAILKSIPIVKAALL